MWPIALQGLVGLGLVLLIIGLFLIGWWRKRTLRQSLGEHALLQVLARPASRPVKAAELAFACLTVIFAILALPRLQGATPALGLDPEATDIIAVIDVSKSMAAEDYGTHSRLEKGKEVLLRLLPQLQPGTRVGLVTFAGASFRQADLTEDMTALTFILKHWVKVDAIPIGGSELSIALQAGIAAFEEKARPRWLLLLSDGGDWEEDLVPVVQQAQRQAINIISIGLGDRTPARIPQYDQHGAFRGYLTHQGQTLTTALNEDILIDLAEATGGRYVRIQSGRELAPVFSQPESTSPVAVKPAESFQGFLFLSLLSLVATILCERGCPILRKPSSHRQHPQARRLLQGRRLGPGATSS